MIRVERITPSQWPLLKSLRCQALADAPYAFSTTLEEAQRRPDDEWISSASKMATDEHTATFIAYHDDEPCGMMSCYTTGEHNETGNIVSAWVAPEVRRLKVTLQLFEATRQWAKESKTQVLHAWVAERNIPARRFWESRGFQYTEQSEIFQSDPSQRIFLLTQQLS